MKSAVVIGGSGFLGSHVADELSEAGFNVRIYDLSVSKWKKHNQQTIIGSILDREHLTKALKDTDVVYNFAALADLNDALNKPLETATINIIGNLNVLEACRINKVKHFVYASTVYVNSSEGGFYRCSKRASEDFIKEYKKLYNLDYTILRFGSLYGLRTGTSNGIWRIVENAVLNGKIEYQGDPETMRSYIHVSDAAKASVEILQIPLKNQNIILTGHEPMKVIDLLKLLAEILCIPEKKINFNKKKQIGHYIRTPYNYTNEISKKYIPSFYIDLGEGLLELIKHIKEKKNQ